MKTCTRCGRSREIDCFQFKPRRGNPCWSGQCRDCVNAAGRERHLAKTLADGRQPPARPFADPGTGEMVKRCTGCERVLPVDAFGPRSATDRKPKPRCRECVADARRETYHADPERYRAEARDWHRRNRDKALAQLAAYKERNRERLRQYHRDRYARIRAQSGLRTRTRTVMPSHERAAQRAAAARLRRAANPDKAYDESVRKRAKRYGALVVGDVARSEVIARDQSRCYLCGREVSGRELTIDHLVPFTRGGSHSLANVRVACFDCNRRKGSRTPEEFLSCSGPKEGCGSGHGDNSRGSRPRVSKRVSGEGATALLG